jgi:predicted amidohydrolase YtcJ
MSLRPRRPPSAVDHSAQRVDDVLDPDDCHAGRTQAADRRDELEHLSFGEPASSRRAGTLGLVASARAS